MAPVSLDLSRVALKRRRTKIVATLGPASNSPEMLAKLVAAGVDVFRLNFSHGTQAQHGETYLKVREAARKANKHLAILADLCGPKIRAGMFEGGGIDLVAGAEVTVTTRDDVTGKPGLISSEYKALPQDVKANDRILLDDGKLEHGVQSVKAQDIMPGGLRRAAHQQEGSTPRQRLHPGATERITPMRSSRAGLGSTTSPSFALGGGHPLAEGAARGGRLPHPGGGEDRGPRRCGSRRDPRPPTR